MSSTRDPHILALLRTHLADIPAITQDQIEEVCDLWQRLKDHTRDLRNADKVLAAGVEYLWHTLQPEPLRSQKEVAAAYGVSASSISQLQHKLARLLSPLDRPPHNAHTPHGARITYDSADPAALPTSLPALHHHLSELFALGLWTTHRPSSRRFYLIEPAGVDISMLCVIPEDQAPPGIGLLPLFEDQDATLLMQGILTNKMPFADLPKVNISLLPPSSFHPETLAALLKADLSPIHDGLYPFISETISLYDGPEGEAPYLLGEAFLGALLTLLRLEPHTDARTHLQITWEHLGLGNFRVAPVASALTPSTPATPGEHAPRSFEQEAEFYTLEVSLKHSKPRIWRRIRLRSNLSFLDLHHAIQDCMEWYDGHLWEFRPPKSFEAFASRPTHEHFHAFHDDQRGVPADELPLFAYFGDGQTSCTYVYDFGDDWEHTIKLEKAEHLPLLETPARELLAGKQHAPFEDCGGIPGFERLMTIAKTGKDPWKADRAEIRELKEHYELDDLGDFDLEELQEYFDEMTEERHGSSSSPQALRASPLADDSSSPADLNTIPTSSKDPVLTTFCALMKSPHEDVHPQLLDVFDLLIDYGVLYQWPMIVHKFALMAWSACLASGQFKKRSPAIYAGAVLYALSLELLEGGGPSQANIAESLGTSSVSISKTYPPILTIIQEQITDRMKLLMH